MRFHGVIGDTVFIFDELFPGIDEFFVFIRFNTHEIIPRSQMAHQWLGVETGKFFLTHGKGNNRNIFGGNTLVTQFLVERNIGIAINGGDYCCLFTCVAEFFDVGNNGLPIRMAKRRVVDHDVFFLNAFCNEIGFKDFIGGARIHIIGTGQHPTFNTNIIHQIINSGNGLLIRCCTSVKYIL